LVLEAVVEEQEREQVLVLAQQVEREVLVVEVVEHLPPEELEEQGSLSFDMFLYLPPPSALVPKAQTPPLPLVHLLQR